MTTGLILIFITGILWSGNGIVFSYIARKKINFAAVMVPVNAACVILSFLIFTNHRVLFNEDIPYFKELSITMLISGMFAALGFTLMQTAWKKGHHGVIWTISQSAMVVPFLFGVIIFSDDINIIKSSGMGLILLSFIFFGFGMKNKEKNIRPGNYLWFWQALLVFILIGIQQSLTTLPSYWDGWSDTADIRTPILFLGIFFTYLAFMAVQKQYPDRQTLKLSLYIILFSVPGQHALFMGIDHLNKVKMVAIAYPLAVGITILFFVFYSLFYLKEKTSKASILGIFVAMAGLVLVSI